MTAINPKGVETREEASMSEGKVQVEIVYCVS